MNRRLLLSLLGLCLVLAFAALGHWQLGREDSKRTQLAQAAEALAAPARALGPASREAGLAPVKVLGAGFFMPTPRLLLDNQRRGSQVGMRLYCAFQPESGQALLVDMGWLPLAPNRALPGASCPVGEFELAGLLVPPPSVGLPMGPGVVEQLDGQGWLATRLETGALSAAWKLEGPLAPRVLRLDPALPIGHERDLELLPNTLPPEKHRGYAVQWFGLAIATFVILLVLNFRRRP
ncbi:MAG: SURF1 family protein [Arenimonas sp.]|uniref:SURF1 family protein n=1 Tax=Arenimonas sp. TaxID=1872635 RepID=UPI0025C4759D|nr:SURF1 family protein [Arenimonas sp.]MBW8366235.1 SURF1 family protein [Arenimonas sp.]